MGITQFFFPSVNWWISGLFLGFHDYEQSCYKHSLVSVYISINFPASWEICMEVIMPLTVWITINCGKFCKRWEYLTCLLRNLYAAQEATVRTRHGTTDWFQIGKGVHQGCILSLCLFNWYAEYIMRNAGLDEAQAGIKIAGRNINNLRYADDTTLMAESEKN